MGVLFDLVFPNATDADRARHEAVKADLREHTQTRPCPNSCGCTEVYDDRNPDKMTGGFGPAGCRCPRCEGEE